MKPTIKTFFKAAKCRSRSATYILIAALTACLSTSDDLGQAFEITLEVTLKYADREVLEGYDLSYTHQVVSSLNGISRLSSISNVTGRIYEECLDPEFKVEWDLSGEGVVFDDFDYDVPSLYSLRKGTDIWFLYDPASAFGVVHPGRKACGPEDDIDAGKPVAKFYFSETLAEGASTEEGRPAYFYGDAQAVGGFVIAVTPLEELESGLSKEIETTHRYEDELVEISIELFATITMKE